jgi:hypothetical protein
MFPHLQDLRRHGVLLTIAAELLTTHVEVFAQTVLFFDDFNGSKLNASFQPLLPNGAPQGDGSGSCTCLGASDYSFETVDGVSVLHMTTTLDNWQRRGWSTSDAFAVSDFRYEVRFNVLVQSPATSIDSFVEAWLIDPTEAARYRFAGPSGGDYGRDRQFRGGGSIDRNYASPGYNYADNTWYRLLIEAPPGHNIRVALLADDGATELVGRELAYSASAFPDGFQIGLGQATGAPDGAYPVDVAIDWIRLTTSSSTLLSGDYNSDGTVDAADYVVWRNASGQAGAGLTADGNGDGTVNQADYDVWRASFGQTAAAKSITSTVSVPEPCTAGILSCSVVTALCLGAIRYSKPRVPHYTEMFHLHGRFDY